MKALRFLISKELLHSNLLLPEGCEVEGLVWDGERRGYQVSVRGDALPDKYQVIDGSFIQLVTPHYRTVDGKPEFGGWDYA